MDEHRQQISSIISTTSLIAVVAIGSFILFDKPFQSERPPSNISTSLLESRLWEDPFAAVFSLRDMEEQYLGADESQKKFINLYNNYTRNCAEFSKTHLTVENGEPPIVLGVTLPGNRFTLSGEIRRRIRYAVLSAINQTHVPLSSESISILSLASPLDGKYSSNETDCESTLKRNVQRYLASVEIFRPYKPKTADMDASPESYVNRDIIVLWLPEEELGTEILKNYAGLLRHIDPDSIIPLNSVLLGPISSNGLVDIQVERFNSNALTIVPDDIKSLIEEKNISPPYDSLKPDRLIFETSLYTQSIISRIQQLSFLDCLDGTSSGESVDEAETLDDVAATKKYSVREAQKCLNDLASYYDDPDWPSTVISRLSRDQIVDPIEDITLREDLLKLLRALNEQDFRNGFPEELKRDLVSCLVFEKPTTYLSNEAISTCLETLKIADSSSAWYDPVAKVFPDASIIAMFDEVPGGDSAGIAKLITAVKGYFDDSLTGDRQRVSGELRADIARLIIMADGYLDNGMPDDKREALIACVIEEHAIATLTRDNVAPCLQQLDIPDSDDTWYDTIANKWPDASIMAALDNLPGEFSANVTSLIGSVDGYLDNGLPEQKLEPLLLCLGDGGDITALSRAGVATCLKALAIEDGDTVWFDTMANNWPEADIMAELDHLSASLQPEVAILIATAEDVLGAALPDAQRDELVDCLIERPITTLTSNIAAFCLSRLNVDDFAVASVVMERISAQWPPAGLAAVPAPLRTDVASFIDSANLFIEPDLTDENRTAFISCLVSDGQLSALTQENMLPCLEGLELGVMEDTYASILQGWPRQDELEETQSVPEALRTDVTNLIDSADSYLDDGLPDDKRTPLIGCFSESRGIPALTRNNVASCLEDLAIKDSDATWFNTLANNWPDAIDLPELDEVLKPVRNDVANLIEVANNLLENDLPTDRNDEFVKCFAGAAISSYNFMSGCLKNLVSWYDEIASAWPKAHLMTELGKVPEPLRSDATLLAKSVDGYLDDGLPDDKVAPLLACLTSGEKIAALTRDTITPCLRALNIADGNPTWFDTIASKWPEASRLAELGTVAEALRPEVIRLVDRADSYLSGLPDARRLELIACFAADKAIAALTHDNVASCLQEFAIAGDDPALVDSIASDWPSAGILAELGNVAEVLRADMIRLIDVSHAYLDIGLSDDKRTALIECFANESGITALTRDNVASCLQALEIDDGDVTWFDTIARNWLDAGRLAELSSVPPALRTDVIALIESVNNSLYTGLPADKRIALTACYAEKNAIAALTRENVSSCLERINIPYTWHETIAKKFQTALTIDRALVLSPRATISRIPLIVEAGVGVDDSTSPIIRTIKSDGILLDAVFQELTRNRGLDPSRANVALVYENDGKFGRALESRLKCKPGSVNLPICFDVVKSFGYLRGIDGLLAKDANTTNSGQGNTDNTTIEGLMQANENLENPFGQHQYDYLRRLADEIGKEKYDVIGVLGTDIFDKLLVLQALRQKNPDAVFFTTDLDDYMAHASQSNWTQNLLVASSFGLNGLNDKGNDCSELSGSSGETAGSVFAPPFRDSYQTSYFYSTCLALQVPGLGKTGVRHAVNNDLLDREVRLYEVGRNGLHVLPNSNDDSAPLFSITFWRRIFANMSWALFMLPSIAVMALAFRQRARLGAQISNTDSSQPARVSATLANQKLALALTRCFWICIFTIVVMSLLLIAEAQLPGGEPLEPAQGISHWPATLIRIQILTLSICFYLYATRTGMANRKQVDQLLSKTNQREPETEPDSSDTTESRGISGWIKDIDNDHGDDYRARKDFRDIWKRHIRITPSSRYTYIICKTLIIAVVVFTAFYVLTPQPYLIRDSYFVADLLFDKYFVYAKPFAFLVGIIAIAAIVIANDVIRLNRASIRALRKYEVTGGFCNLAAFNHRNYLDNRINEVIFKLEFIAKRTRDIELSIMFPFVIVLLAIISRSTLFEGWHWSLPLIVLYCLISAYLLYCVIMLQVEASLTKKDALDFLAQQQREYCSIDQPMRAVLEEELRVATRHVTGLNKGAFAAWYRHPLLLSMALPTSGTSGLLMLQQFF